MGWANRTMWDWEQKGLPLLSSRTTWRASSISLHLIVLLATAATVVREEEIGVDILLEKVELRLSVHLKTA